MRTSVRSVYVYLQNVKQVLGTTHSIIMFSNVKSNAMNPVQVNEPQMCQIRRDLAASQD